MRTTRHSLMAKGILVLLSLLIMIFVFTYSWYAPENKPIVASGITATLHNLRPEELISIPLLQMLLIRI